MTVSHLKNSLLGWVDNRAYVASKSPSANQEDGRSIDWARIVPFLLLHLSCLAAFYVGWSATALIVALLSYVVRMFAITGFYHRYFSHRSFKTSRVLQFAFALIGASATQRGPIWWAANHRHHHVNSDTDQDCHSPRHGIWWSHVGWFLHEGHFSTKSGKTADLEKFPELKWLDRFDTVVPVGYALLLYIFGEVLASHYPSLGTNGLQLVIWGFAISTVALLHGTLFINSMAHRVGSKRFETGDDSRNNFILALITLGEGWHNNHHYYPVSARQGFFWWEVDITYYLLRGLAFMGLVWDLKAIPKHKLTQNLVPKGNQA